MKKYLFGAIALFIAVASVAFTTAPASKTTDIYYVFNGGSDDDMDVIDNWEYVGTSAPSTCLGSDETVCFIKTSRTTTQFESYINTVHPETKAALENDETISIEDERPE
jgi:hypothetical protein